MAIVVRIATPHDEQAAKRVGDAAFATVRAIYRPNPAASMSLSSIAPALKRLVAKDGGRIVGTVRFGISQSCLRVVGLGVLPEARRRGVARAMLDELASLAKSNDCRALALYTVTQTGNVTVFERLGFHVVSEGPDPYSISPDGEALTEAYMERSVV
jgi:ribosomal protein S18 acetylase RimI-like enzyme